MFANRTGPVPEADNDDVINALDQYVSTGGKLEFGEYNVLERQRAVVAPELLRCKAILETIMQKAVPSGRILARQMTAALQAVIARRGRHALYPAAQQQSVERLCKATTISLSVMFAHLRRLRCETRFLQATAHMPEIGKIELRKLVAMLATDESLAKSNSRRSLLSSEADADGDASPISRSESVRLACSRSESPEARPEPSAPSTVIKVDANGWPLIETDSEAPATASDPDSETAEESDAHEREFDALFLNLTGDARVEPLIDSDAENPTNRKAHNRTIDDDLDMLFLDLKDKEDMVDPFGMNAQLEVRAAQLGQKSTDLDGLDAQVDAEFTIPKVKQDALVVRLQKPMPGSSRARQECLRLGLVDAAASPLPGDRDGPRRVIGEQSESKKKGQKRKRAGKNPTGEISIGQIKCETYTNKSYIRVLKESKWRLVVNLELKVCFDHQAVIKEGFNTALALDQDAIAMQANKAELVNAANGARRAVVHEESDGCV